MLMLLMMVKIFNIDRELNSFAFLSVTFLRHLLLDILLIIVLTIHVVVDAVSFSLFTIVRSFPCFYYSNVVYQN